MDHQNTKPDRHLDRVLSLYIHFPWIGIYSPFDMWCGNPQTACKMSSQSVSAIWSESGIVSRFSMCCRVRYLHIFHQLKVMQTRAGVNRCDRAMLLAQLKPRPTSCRPNQSLHQFMGMIVQFPDTFFFGLESFDIFGLEFVDHLKHIPGVPFQDREKWTMTRGAIRADEHCVSCQ